jgi:ankyrin repeat protein
MQAAASGIEKDFTLLVSSFREGNYLKLITIAEQNPDLLISQIRQNPKALLIQNPEGNTFLHELTEQGHKELAIQLAKLNSYDIKIENGYIKFLYDSPGFLNYSDIKIAEKSIQNSAEIELDEIEMQFTDTFGEALGEENQLPEEQPLLKNQNLHFQPSPTLPIPQEIKQQKQESSIHEDQKNLNEELLQACKNNKKMRALLLVRKGANPNALCQSGESAISYAKATGDNRLVTELQKEENEKNHTEIITPLTPITIREKDENGNTRIHKLIESKKVTELKRFIEENTEILKATPIIDDFQSVPAICLRSDRGENPLHMMLLDLDTWGDELIIQIAKLHPGMIHVEDNFGIIPFDLTQPKSNLEKAFIELDPLANNFGKARKIDIEENNQNNKKGKEPIQEIRRRKGKDEGKLITVNQSLPVFQPKQNSLPKYAAYGGLIGAGLGAGGVLIAIGIASAIALSWSFPPLGLALTIIGACTALGLTTGATYSKKDVIANKIATIFHKSTADNKTFIIEPEAHLKNA